MTEGETRPFFRLGTVGSITSIENCLGFSTCEGVSDDASAEFFFNEGGDEATVIEVAGEEVKSVVDRSEPVSGDEERRPGLCLILDSGGLDGMSFGIGGSCGIVLEDDKVLSA